MDVRRFSALGGEFEDVTLCIVGGQVDLVSEAIVGNVRLGGEAVVDDRFSLKPIVFTCSNWFTCFGVLGVSLFGKFNSISR